MSSARAIGARAARRARSTRIAEQHRARPAARRSRSPRDGRLLGVVHLKDIVKGGIRERFAELRRMGIRTVMITGDNPLTAAAIAAEAGVDDFLAQATPEAKLQLIREEQAKGKLVAMCGDGTNDAPALAQADVGVAMNTGTMAAREAGNMVDLDSDPTKLIEIVEIGKQLLMTRGALTTFSIANDVAKYFAIIPAMFLAFYPQLGALNVMRLATPQSAILSAIIFNALIIVALIPLALRGVRYRPVGAAALLRAQPADLRPRRHRRAVHRHQADRHRRHRHRPRLRTSPCCKQLRPAIVMLVLLMTVLTGLAYPLAMTGIAQALFPHQANGSLIESDGKVIGSDADRPELHRRQVFPRPPVGDDRHRPDRRDQDGAGALQRRQLGGSNLGPTSKALVERVAGRRREAARPRTRRSRCRSTSSPTSGSGLDPDISPAAALLPGAARRQGARPAEAERARPGRRSTSRAASSASSASRASTCCGSTWRSTRWRRRAADELMARLRWPERSPRSTTAALARRAARRGGRRRSAAG